VRTSTRASGDTMSGVPHCAEVWLVDIACKPRLER
jgi:hypothetical protein